MAGKVQRKVHVQLSLDRARRPDGKHGGWRPKAGRKKKRGSISHDTRPEFPSRYPQHVTLRLVDGAPNIAGDWLQKTMRQSIRDSHKADFRTVEFNVLNNNCTSWSRLPGSARCTWACRASRSGSQNA